MTYEQKKSAIEAMPEDTMFYFQSYGFVGNCLNLWAKGGGGYTTHVDKAEKYTKQQTLGQLGCKRTQDTFWVASEIESKAYLMVDAQLLDIKNRF